MTEVQQQISLAEQKLAHYNAWLLAPNREVGTAYPGFPGAVRTIAVAPKTPKTPKVPKTVIKTPKKSGPSKLDQARVLFRENSKLSRVNMIALFVEKVGLTPSGASTYYYNVQK